MVKRGRHAGFLLLTDDKCAVILQANKSYNDNINKNLKYNKHIPFVEKLSIPRGKHDVGEKDYETAVREFIEETGLIFDKVYVFDEPFVLEWQDNTKMYKYTIYVAFLNGSLNSLRKPPNSYNIRLLKIGNDATVSYKVDMVKQKFKTHELVRRIEFMSLKKYMMYMENRQLSTYNYSNYNIFFNYVTSVRDEFVKGELKRFFSIELFWFTDSDKLNKVFLRWKCLLITIPVL